MPLSVAESPAVPMVPAFVLILLLLLVLPVVPVGAQERATDTATATDVAADEADSADTVAGNEDAEGAAEDAAGDAFQVTMGLALGAFVIPVEADLTADTVAPELYVDVDLASWLGLRLGINSTEMKLDELTLRTTTVYLAYRHAVQVTGPWWGELIAGVASSDSVLSSERTELTASGSGHMLGAAAWRRMGQFDVGLRYQLLFTESAFSGITLNTGSNQVQITAAYRWF